jgi:Cd2+/Zn2+-exporting ATPase
MSRAMVEEPGLEAVVVPNAGAELTIATMGRDIPSTLEARIGEAVAAGTTEGTKAGCGLIDGTNDCRTCPNPLGTDSLQLLDVERTTESTRFSRKTCLTAPNFWQWRNIPFPRFVQREVELPEHVHFDEWKWQLFAAVLCGVLGLAAYFTSHETIRVVLFAASYLSGAWFPAQETWERLRERAIDVHFLMLAVAAGSASIGAWSEGAMLLFLFSISGALEHFALGRTQKEINALFADAPKTATVIDASGNETETPVEKLLPGMMLAIKPDTQFPVDGQVTKGTTAVDESTLSGESNPADKQPGDSVMAGTMNLWGAVRVEVTRPAAESALQKIIQLIREAQRSKAPSQRLTDRFGSGYTVIVLMLTLIMYFVWWLGYGLPPFISTEAISSAFYRAMTLLVVASPCALVLSIPSAILAAIASAARRGVLFRGGAAVEKLAEVDIVALDKTGTLTTGNLTVESIETNPPGHEQELATIATSLAKHSTHPLSRAITEHAKRQHWNSIELDHFESEPGQGVSGRSEDHVYLLGRREFIESLSDRAMFDRTTKLNTSERPQFAQPEVWVTGNNFAGVIRMRDDVRPEAAALIDDLRAQHLKTVLLTGDNSANADAVRKQLNLDEVLAELRPDDKLRYIVKQNESGHRVAMIGDGVNDAPSLAAAHVGVAMGARGSDAALEQADVILMHDRLEKFLIAFQLSQRAKRIIQQNLFVSLGTVIVLVGFALAGEIPLTLGVLGHEGSTVIVVMNSLRLLFGQDR